MSVQDHVSVGAEIRTLLPSWSPDDFAMEDLQAPSRGLGAPVSFAIKVACILVELGAWYASIQVACLSIDSGMREAPW